VQDPVPTRPTDLVSPNKWPAPRRRSRRQRTVADRLTATRCLTATETPTHGASAVHVVAALGPEIDEAARRRSRADGQHQHPGTSADIHDEAHPLLNHREAGR
jgi:hypothetical protein